MPGVFTQILFLQVACLIISIGCYIIIFTTILPEGSISCFQAVPHGSSLIRSKIRKADKTQ